MDTLKNKNSKVMASGAQIKNADDWYHNIILSVATSAIIGCFIFLWNVNADLVKAEQQNIDTAKVLDEVRIRINNIQLDIRDIRERVIRLETVTPKK